MTPDRTRMRELGQYVVWFFALGVGLIAGPLLFFSSAGILLQLLLLATAGGAWLFAIWRGKAVASLGLDGPLLAFVVATAAAAYFSVDPGRSWRVVWYWISFVVLLYSAAAAFRRGWEPRQAGRAFLILVAVLVFIAYYQLYLQIASWRAVLDWLAPLPPAFMRVWSITDSPNTFGAILAAALPFALAYAGHARGTGRIWPVLWLLLAVPILILTRSRGGLLAAVAGVILYWQRDLLIGLQNGTLRRTGVGRRLLAVGLVVAAVGTTMIVLRPGTLMLLRDSTLNNRFGYWQVAVNIFAAHPWTGAGPYTFSTFFLQQIAPRELITMPHNLFLAVLSMGGVAGLIVLLWLVLGAARRFWRANLAAWSTWEWAALSGLGALLLYAQLDVVLVRPGLLFIIVLYGAILLAASGKLPAERESDRPEQVLRVVWTGIWVVLLVSGARDWQASRFYDRGVQALAEGDWSAAGVAFRQGGAAGALDDSAFLAAEALSLGMDAAGDSRMLDEAVDAYERLVEVEPGWVGNHVNLAALYWQAGRESRALEKMDYALTYAPDAGIFWLNAALWAEAAGAETDARAAFRRAYLTGDLWTGAPLWSIVLPDGRPETSELVDRPEIAAGNSALETGAYQVALAEFEKAVDAMPYDPMAHLGAGIASFMLGEPEADVAWQRAAELGSSRNSLGLPWRNQGIVDLWELIDELQASPEALAAALEIRLSKPVRLKSGLANYPYLRPSLPVDLLPQLQCVTVSDSIEWHLQLIRRYFEERDQPIVVERIDDIISGDGRGLRSCGG